MMCLSTKSQITTFETRADYCNLNSTPKDTAIGHFNILVPTKMAAYVMLDRTEFTYETNNFKLFNLLWTTDTIRWDKSGSTLARAMTYCLLAPSHFLILEWPIINWLLYGTRQMPISQEVIEISILKGLKIHLAKLLEYSPGTTEWMGYFSCSYPYSLAVNSLWTSDNTWHCLGLWLVSSRCHAITWPSDVL